MNLLSGYGSDASSDEDEQEVVPRHSTPRAFTSAPTSWRTSQQQETISKLNYDEPVGACVCSHRGASVIQAACVNAVSKLAQHYTFDDDPAYVKSAQHSALCSFTC